MERNNTNFPTEVSVKLTALYKKYVEEKEAKKGWAKSLSYHQYVVREIMTNREYGIGDNGNSRGLLVYHTMGMGKTRLAASVAVSLMGRHDIVVFLPKGLQENFDKTIKKLSSKSAEKLSYVSMDAYNSSDQFNRKKKHTPLDNKLLIVDEAHNFFRSIINSGGEQTNSMKIYDMIMKARNLKILFLTGTPSSKDPFELVPCFNMLSGVNIFPSFYEEFYKLYVDGNKMKNKNFFQNRIFGMVSHVNPSWKSSPEETDIKNPGDDDWFPVQLPTIVEKVEMGSMQYNSYLQAREQENKETIGSKFVKKEHAMSMPGSAKKGSKTYNVKSRNASTFYRPPGLEGKPLEEFDKSHFVQENAPKLHLIAEKAFEAEGPVLIYSQFITSGGLLPMTKYLEEKGFSKFNTTPGKFKYAMIYGEISHAERSEIVKAFNHIDNIRGDNIKVILVSKTGAEGLDLNFIRETHQIEPYWDKARDFQVISRAVRMGSHNDLPQEERTVQPYLYIGTRNEQVYATLEEETREEKTIDEIFLERSDSKFLLNEEFRKALTEVCFECISNGYEDCKKCMPTGMKLFSSNPGNDVFLPDPCIKHEDIEIEVQEIEYEEKKYSYSKNDDSVIGYDFYRFDDKFDSWTQINNSDPIIVNLLELV